MSYVATQRVVRATTATIEWQGIDQDGEPADPGTVTIGVTRADGAAVVAPGTATDVVGTVRRYTLPVSATANLDRLTATWTVSGVAVGTTSVEVVGGVYASVAQIRTVDPVVSNLVTDSTDVLKNARAAAESLFETVTGVAWVPKFDVVRLDGTGRHELALPWPQLRRVRWCRIYSTETTYDTLTADQLAAIPADDSGIAVRTDGYVWTAGTRNVEIAYEHGYDVPPADLRDALIQTVRANARQFDNGIDPRTTQVVMEGMTATIGASDDLTGNPAVDATLRRHSHKIPGIA